MPKLKTLTPYRDMTDDEYNKRMRLDDIMKSKKIRQYRLAEYLCVKQGTVSNWKTGRTPMPSNYVYDVCKFLDITPNELFGW